MRSLTILFTLMAAFMLAACDSGVMGPSVDDFKQVQEGMSQDEVRELVGKPTKTVEPEDDGEQLKELWVTMEHKLTVTYDNGQVANARVESLSGGGTGGGDSGPDMPTSPDEQREMQGQPGEQPASP